jgi:hypothetical protein
LSKIARSLGVVALAAAPFLALATPAHAAAGCSVDNASTTTILKIEIQVPPGTVTHDWTSESCSYVSNGGQVNLSCNLIAGRCQAFKNGVEVARCTAANSICSNSVVAAPGDTMTLVVDGGSGSLQDAA